MNPPCAVQDKPWPAERVVFLNDVWLCAGDVMRLLAHEGAHMACGMDFDRPHIAQMARQVSSSSCDGRKSFSARCRWLLCDGWRSAAGMCSVCHPSCKAACPDPRPGTSSALEAVLAVPSLATAQCAIGLSPPHAQEQRRLFAAWLASRAWVPRPLGHVMARWTLLLRQWRDSAKTETAFQVSSQWRFGQRGFRGVSVQRR